MFTYYELLGVSPKANSSQIKKAYKERAKKIHPDVVHDDEALWKMKRLNRAYTVLKDSSRRAEYDASITESGHYQCETATMKTANLNWLGVSVLWLIALVAITFFSQPLWDAQITNLSILHLGQ